MQSVTVAIGRTDPDCQDAVFHPAFPASSPFVTSVGATQLNDPSEVVDPVEPICKTSSCAAGGTEVAVSFDASGFASGGGFSVYSTRPQYQDDAVSDYCRCLNSQDIQRVLNVSQ